MTIKLRFTKQMKDTLLDAIECMEYVIEKGQEKEFNNESKINN